jgi:guanine deaminase
VSGESGAVDGAAGAVRGGLLLPRPDRTLDWIPDAIVAWDAAGLVTHAGPAADRAAREGGEAAGDWFELGSDAVLVPGFIDLHVHLPQLALRGQNPASLLTWLHRGVFAAEAELADPMRAREAADAFDRALAAAGTTAAGVYTTVHEETARIALRTLRMRGWVGKVLMDVEAPAALCEPAQRGVAATERLIAEFGRERVAVTPRFAVSATMDLLAAAGRLAKKHGTPVMTHLAESAEEVAMVRRFFPQHRTYTTVYAAAGLLTPRTVVAHAIHVEDADLALLAKRGTVIAHCPTANLALGSGRMPLERLLAVGVEFALGTDVGAGPSLSMWHVIAAFLRVHAGRVDVTPAEALYRATLAGAQVLGFDGRLAPGAPADLAAFARPAGALGPGSGPELVRALAEATADDPEPEALLTVRGGEILHCATRLG